ncbi:site-2 protease family protein [Nocardioides sp. TF02-7]|uniref:site-2 protease family protein n=1 Tax=Nocardioides sp. TF02-7 TaxID=2917724 RepID=UPI001F06F995|nr:site-2 protease family protein [Nocardioides sp. TF02-7]UMG92012.1 site-2 protease family protein [Nocardioides sp. TF02-7]
MTALLYTLGVVVFAVAILVSIALHEVGHLVPAKKFGGKVTQYFVGFGPTVWSKQVGETGVRRQGDPARRLREDRRDAPRRVPPSWPTR